MKSLLFDIERFLRWLADLTPAQRTERAADISEAAQVFAEALEPIVDAMEDDDETSNEETEPDDDVL